MKDVTSSQTYQKGSWILHMLRGVLGTEIFWKGIRVYYNKYKDLNVRTSDFKRIMENVSKKDLSVFFDQWLYKPGIFKLKGNWKYDRKKSQVIIDLKQIQNDGSLFQMPIEIEIIYKNDIKQIELIQIKTKSNLFAINVDKEPKNVIIDPNYWVLMNKDFKKKN